jgi:hypothetical protein
VSNPCLFLSYHWVIKVTLSCKLSMRKINLMKHPTPHEGILDLCLATSYILSVQFSRLYQWCKLIIFYEWIKRNQALNSVWIDLYTNVCINTCTYIWFTTPFIMANSYILHSFSLLNIQGCQVHNEFITLCMAWKKNACMTVVT